MLIPYSLKWLKIMAGKEKNIFLQTRKYLIGVRTRTSGKIRFLIA
jgi:hypothetical protein